MSVAALPRNETSATRSVLVSGSGEQVARVSAFAVAGASVLALTGAVIGAVVGVTVIPVGVLLLVGLLLLAGLLITTGCGPPN